MRKYGALETKLKSLKMHLGDNGYQKLGEKFHSFKETEQNSLSWDDLNSMDYLTQSVWRQAYVYSVTDFGLKVDIHREKYLPRLQLVPDRVRD